MSAPLTIDQFNAMPADVASELIRGWLDCKWWVKQVVAHRPYANLAEVTAAATEFWRQATPTQQREAFAAHPLIGDVELLRSRFASAATDRAHSEQGQVLGASDKVLERLAEGNRAYRERHGFIFIICASGLSAEAMLATLERRLPNDSALELLNAAIEQERIMQLRLAAAFGSSQDPT